MRPLTYEGAHAIVLCFAVNDRTALDRIKENWIREIQYFCNKTPIILVGCKTDLREKHSEDHVSPEEVSNQCAETDRR
ncbi:hypothetical protein EYZ11_010932 [Aspergillus tanneri]|uniref:Rho GTPase n=1 Tax=Aspergillus tanneri TaxID=1220188 RepID=A0A4S3J9J1_9EURO|nr:hypothetical protein EYZ11_010932 [Aspergillus tanneri]